jgi:hypothetical protein
MERTSDPRLLDWLRDPMHGGDEVTGFDATGWEASIWILHAMYEHERPPARQGGPGPGRHRVRWSDLARRLDIDPFEGSRPPSYRSFLSRWPELLAAASEGELLSWELERLVDHLVEATSGREDARCVVLYSAIYANTPDELVLFRAELKELVHLPDATGIPGPCNLWPDDRSWFVYTDNDLWGTKVSGSAELVAALRGDSELETSSLGF